MSELEGRGEDRESSRYESAMWGQRPNDAPAIYGFVMETVSNNEISMLRK